MTAPRVIVDPGYTGDTGPRVAIIGDSLTWASRTYLFSEFSGDYRVKIASAIGEGIGGGPWSDFSGHDVMGRATRDYLSEDPPTRS